MSRGFLESIGHWSAKVLISLSREDASARGASDKTLLDQVGLYNIFNGTAFLANRRRQTIDTHWAAGKVFQHGGQQTAVHMIKAALVHLEHIQRPIGHFR